MWGGVDGRCTGNLSSAQTERRMVPIYSRSHQLEPSLNYRALLPDLHPAAGPLLTCTKPLWRFLMCYFWTLNILPPNPIRSRERLLFLIPFHQKLPFPKHVLANIFVLFFKSGSLTRFDASATPTSDHREILQAVSSPHRAQCSLQANLRRTPNLALRLLLRGGSHHVLRPERLFNLESVGYSPETHTHTH